VSLKILDIVEAVSKVQDPEIPVNICELGLLYGIQIYPLGNVHVIMTLTSPNCPAAELLPMQVEESVRAVDGVNDVKIEVTFDPPYDAKMMSELAKCELGFL
jgi:FeS assembly SUF system protein